MDHEPVTASRRKAVALLAYLSVDGDRHTRDSLSALLWPNYDQSKAFANLRHTLWEVQQTIGEGWIAAERETIALHPDAVKLYRNHFLTGFSLKDAPGFNEWAFAKSEELRRQLAGALLMLSEDYCVLGQVEQAIPYARRLITLDPLNEASHRQLMRPYIQAGQHSAALKQYQACEQILRRELGIDPQPETLDLYKKIRKREIKPVRVESREEKRAPTHNLPHQLSSFIGREKEQKAIAKRSLDYRVGFAFRPGIGTTDGCCDLRYPGEVGRIHP